MLRRGAYTNVIKVRPCVMKVRPAVFPTPTRRCILWREQSEATRDESEARRCPCHFQFHAPLLSGVIKVRLLSAVIKVRLSGVKKVRLLFAVIKVRLSIKLCHQHGLLSFHANW